ncbi:MAG TPA: aldehyde dehydrogenase family protein [Kineosporiaceae bacterium]|nr:aldehyde dehydrogenase family protein [Kineosporiaceae bacterium]
MTIQEAISEQRSATLDAVLADLGRGEAVWAATPVAARGELLARVHELTGRHAQAWVDAAAVIKGLPADSPLLGEEWLSGPYGVLNGVAVLIESLTALQGGGSPVDGYAFGRAPGHRVTVKTLPHSLFDQILLSGFSAEVWLSPGVDEATVRNRAGLAEREPSATHGIAVVLGAGNVSSIPPLDVLYELYANNRVVVLKLNPITDPLFAVLTSVFEPLIEHGVVRIVTGGADVGEYLVHHPQVAHVHMTGSSVTHDAIVFGTGPDGARRKAENRPRLTKQITSELGGVSPTIVLPGAWSKADLRFQAEHLVTQRLHNGGYNCIAGQVAVLSSDWAQKDEFIAEVRAALNRAPGRPAYYPGSDQRVASALQAYPAAERLGPDGGRVLIRPSTAEDREFLLRTEFFAPVLGIIELPGTGQAFLDAAVKTANDDFVGTLGINLIARPSTLKELGAGFEEALARLRYGCIAVNAWTAVGFLTATASWGAFPGHTIEDVQSGIGVVHNALLLENPERTVVRGPFRPFPRSLLNGELSILPRPPWFVTNRTGTTTGRALTEFATKPGWARLPKILVSALRG